MFPVQQVVPAVWAAHVVLEPLGDAPPVEEVGAPHPANGLAALGLREERLDADAALGAVGRRVGVGVGTWVGCRFLQVLS